MSKTKELEEKILKLAEHAVMLKQDNDRLKVEMEALKSHVSMLTNENNKAQRILAEYEQLQKTREQVVHRVERALEKLNTLRAS